MEWLGCRGDALTIAAGILCGAAGVSARALGTGYDGGLLRAAEDLAGRLMPAFDTPTGIPLSWVNLRRVRLPPPRAAWRPCARAALHFSLAFFSVDYFVSDALW